MENQMFCYQCQEAAGCKGCTVTGVCGKKPDVAAVQDLLVYASKGLSAVTTALRGEGREIPKEVNHLVTFNLFTTITNANFDKESLEARVRATLDAKAKLLGELSDRGGLAEAALWDGSGDWAEKARQVGVLSTENEDIRSLRELITYGLKGLSAYTKHANALLRDDADVDAFIQRALAATLDDSLSADDLVALTLETGKYGVAGMALLDKAHTAAYGDPEITRVNIGVGKNPGILVSGHDLRDLEMLLEQTQGTGVDVYTHSEMLPAHCYPAFKKYPNFIGNYGNAWWRQKEEFESFRGTILMTTNCIVPPLDSYKGRLYTTGAAGYPGCPHIPGGIGERKDFSALIEHAKRCAPPSRSKQARSPAALRTRRCSRWPAKWWTPSEAGPSGNSLSWRAATAAPRAASTTPNSPGRFRTTPSSSPPGAPSTGTTSWRSATSAASRACWTRASAMTRTHWPSSR